MIVECSSHIVHAVFVAHLGHTTLGDNSWKGSTSTQMPALIFCSRDNFLVCLQLVQVLILCTQNPSRYVGGYSLSITKMPFLCLTSWLLCPTPVSEQTPWESKAGHSDREVRVWVLWSSPELNGRPLELGLRQWGQSAGHQVEWHLSPLQCLKSGDF